MLICGATGLIKGRQVTTHWSAHHLLPFFGAVPVNKRVVVDGNMVFAASVTSGSTARFTLQPSYAAMRLPRPYSLICNMRPNHPSTVARLRVRPQT